MIIKKYVKSKPVCKVTFDLPAQAIEGAKKVHLVGEFNDWQTTATPMKKSKEGGFKVTLELEKGKEYQFRYLINETKWENDWQADSYVPNNLTFEENSVVTV
jgi:1,4-alpha-glucan branching enzyme